MEISSQLPLFLVGAARLAHASVGCRGTRGEVLPRERKAATTSLFWLCFCMGVNSCPSWSLEMALFGVGGCKGWRAGGKVV